MAGIPDAEERRHHARVRELGCVITRTPKPTIHHCHGGSLRGVVEKGSGRRTSHWLVLPIAAELHCAGPYAMDGAFGVVRWEQMFGTQSYWLCWVCQQLGLDVFAKAGLVMPIDPPKFPPYDGD
jgi:hypothetical protein